MREGIPAFRAVNALDNTQSFVSRWITGQRSPEYELSVQQSEAGNLNSGGVLMGMFAPALTPSDPHFWPSIEPGVQPLVQAIIAMKALATYTSCEGHDYRPFR